MFMPCDWHNFHTPCNEGVLNLVIYYWLLVIVTLEDAVLICESPSDTIWGVLNLVLCDPLFALGSALCGNPHNLFPPEEAYPNPLVRVVNACTPRSSVPLDFYELMRQFAMPWPESHSEDALTGYNEATAATSKGSLVLVGPQFWQYGVSFGSSSLINK